MGELGKWYQKERVRQDKVVPFIPALLTGRLFAYGWYRLRFFTARFGLSVIIHVAELLFFIEMFDGVSLAAIAGVQTVASLSTIVWWSALEVMRTDVRERQEEGLSYVVPSLLKPWLALGLLCTLIGTGLCVVALILGFFLAGSGNELFLWTGFVVLLRPASQFLPMVYHSGAYAVRRIYRPFVAVVSVDILRFVGILILWPFLGAWGFPAVYFLALLLQLLLVFKYVTDTYRLLGWLPVELSLRWIELRKLKSIPLREFGISAAAGLFLGIDSLLVLGLLYQGGMSAEGMLLLFYLISPIIRAAHDWANLFYFDFKKLELDLFSSLKEKFERFLVHLSIALGGIFWLVALTLCLSFLPLQEREMYLVMIPFFVARSYLAFFQIRAFSESRFFDLILTGAVFLGAAFIAPILLDTPEKTFLGLTFIFIAMVAVLKAPRLGLTVMRRRTSPLPVASWLKQVSALRVPVRAGLIEFDTEVAPQQVRAFARGCYPQLGSGGKIALFGARTILWSVPAEYEYSFQESEVVQSGGGMIQKYFTTDSHENGELALQQLIEEQLPSLRPVELSPSDEPRNLLEQEVQEIDLSSVGDQSSLRFSDTQFVNIFRDAVYFCKRLTLFEPANDKAPKREYLVASVGSNASIEKIYILPSNSPFEVRHRFEKIYREKNLSERPEN